MRLRSLLFLTLASLSGDLWAAEEPAVAKVTSTAGTFSAKPASEDYYRVLPANAELKAGEMLATLPGATLAATNGSVTLRCVADYDDKAEIPILESAFTLHEPKDVDFDFTLDRGRVEVSNARAAGKSTVLARFAGEAWSIVLDEPGTKVSLELCGRWPAGTRFRPGMAANDAAPVLVAALHVLAGTADVKVGGQTLALKAKHRILWDSAAGPRPPEVVANLPAWTESKPGPAIEAFRALRVDNSAGAIESFATSDDPLRRRIAIATLGASDDVMRLVRFIGEPRNAEEWDFSPTVLRHWLGRTAGQEKALFDTLRKNSAFTESQARIVLQLLFGFSSDDLKQPETFEVLIDYLLHEKPAIRGLAAWHLARLVPKDKAVPYKLDATPAEREQMHEEWKKRIPSGELPPK